MVHQAISQKRLVAWCICLEKGSFPFWSHQMVLTGASTKASRSRGFVLT
jgi:hypothetical protein